MGSKMEFQNLQQLISHDAMKYITDKELLKKDLSDAQEVVQNDPNVEDILKKKIIDILVSELGNFFTKLLHSIFG